MKGKPAKVLGITAMRQAMRVAARQQYATRNKAIIPLSFKAGLRAGEIAALKWEMILDATGRVGRYIELPACAAKKGSGRRIPLGPELIAALRQLLRQQHTWEGPVIRSSRGRLPDTFTFESIGRNSTIWTCTQRVENPSRDCLAQKLLISGKCKIGGRSMCGAQPSNCVYTGKVVHEFRQQ